MLLGAVEHLRVDLWRRDRHDGRLPVSRCVHSVSATAPVSAGAGPGCAEGVTAGAWAGPRSAPGGPGPVTKGRRAMPEMPVVEVKVCLSRAASGQGTRDDAVQQ